MYTFMPVPIRNALRKRRNGQCERLFFVYLERLNQSLKNSYLLGVNGFMKPCYWVSLALPHGNHFHGSFPGTKESPANCLRIRGIMRLKDKF